MGLLRLTIKHAPLALIAMVLWSCASARNVEESEWTVLELSSDDGKPMHLVGTVHYLDLEGGVYVIRDESGVQYNPINLPDQFKKDGLYVEADAVSRDGMVSIAMVGPLIELSRVRKSDRPTGLVGTTWLLEDLSGSGIVDRTQATLAFLDDGRVSGSGSCNRFNGTVTISRSDITFGDLVSTRKACVEAVMNQEARYFEALEKATRFDVDEPFLLIYVEGSDQPLKFIRAN